MRFFIDAKLIFILSIISLVVVGILLLDILISLLRKVSYVSNMIWYRDRFLVWLLSIWLFGIFPLWLAFTLWLIAFFLLKYIILKKDLVYLEYLANLPRENEMICKSFRDCIKNLFLKPSDSNIEIGNCDFSFLEYTNTLILVPAYYLLGIVSLYPENPTGYIIGFYLVTISIFVLLARLSYAINNQPGNIFERGLFSYFMIAIIGFACFSLATIILRNLGYVAL